MNSSIEGGSPQSYRETLRDRVHQCVSFEPRSSSSLPMLRVLLTYHAVSEACRTTISHILRSVGGMGGILGGLGVRSGVLGNKSQDNFSLFSNLRG